MQRNIPVNERYQKHLTITEEEQYLVGGRHINLHKTKGGEVIPETIRIPSLLDRAKLNRKQTRLADVGELKQYYKPKTEKVLPEVVPYDPELGTEPARLPWKSEPTFILKDTGSELWDWPKPDEKFEDNPHQLGRIMTPEELQAVIKREDHFILEDKWRLIMRLTRVQMARSARMRMPIPRQYVEACRQIPTQFIIDEKDSDKRMREALGILETTKGVSNDLEFGDFSFGGTERTPEEMKKLATSMLNAPAKPGAKPAAKK